MKVAVLVSGGVDSSVALKLLKDCGYKVSAFYLKVWLEDEMQYLGDCPWQEDLSYIRDVCQKLSVPLQVVSLQKEYNCNIVSYTISEIKRGKTPSPDILCNKLIKFGAFFDFIGNRFEKIATGHYAKIDIVEGISILKKSEDLDKDQTYFLSRLSQEQLSRLIFPLGNFKKREVREMAHKYDLITKDRKDSQGICFLGKIDFNDFIRSHIGEKKGILIDIDSDKEVGIHNGFWFYTIGQRKGIGLSNGPWYVVKKDSAKNIVYISNNYYDENKSRNFFKVTDFNWIHKVPNEQKVKLNVKIRHGREVCSCLLCFDDCYLSGSVFLDEQDQGIAPGQFAVFYDDEKCLGSAVIQ